MLLEPHDDRRLAALLARFKPIVPGRRGDPDALERAWGVPLPPSFRGFLTATDGGTLVGSGGVLELWSTRSNLALWREDYRAFKSTPGARVVFFASDGGGSEYLFDVDDWYGCGRYAVLVADRGSDNTEHVAPSFYAALERLADGPRRDYERDLLARPRPPDSERT
ncbi:SMI1/KNR4 family protein [Nannocystis sp. SCPEA4]|uniref:SMI1/KNR4 family protein n=1 Tax=Nannocystis sp. SCPEA4 TaxID=2996787 RepID=UPI00226E0D2F|nr:SMI1/KNR4 family protein [Nannocystis sp. SCPEA4]MCY1061387.1 SMI1/KNR4 family protein [Nannocystis sp. SCPEA4]